MSALGGDGEYITVLWSLSPKALVLVSHLNVLQSKLVGLSIYCSCWCEDFVRILSKTPENLYKYLG